MTAPGLDQQDHFDALATLLQRPAWPVYAEGEVPGLDGNDGAKPPRYYTLGTGGIGVDRTRAPRHATRTSWRVYITAVGDRVAEVIGGQSHAAMALLDARLVVDGHESTPLHREDVREPERRDGVAECESEWTYTL